MDASTSPTTPRGPMTRAHAKAFKDKVNSHLSELPLSTHETWLLPQAETLCVIRYLEEGHRSATPNGQDDEDTEHERQEEELPKKLHRADARRGPDVRRLTLQPADVRPGLDIQCLKAQLTHVPADKSYSKRTSDLLWTTVNTS
ncbi:hypothetical protein VPH35_110830 [Triticum aestivum]